MANFCSNCGSSVDPTAVYCPLCGAALNGTTAGAGAAAATPTAGDTMANVLGTLVAVNLVGGLTRQLYFYRGRYFLDPYCMHPFATPHMIIGRHRLIRPIYRPMPPHGMHRPMGPHGGPRGGGPRGGRR